MKKFLRVGAPVLLLAVSALFITSCSTDDINFISATVVPSVDVTHSISGLVTDMSGSAISGATVTMDDSETTTTGSDGTFLFEGVSAGSHTMTASADGKISKSGTVTISASNTATNATWTVALSNEATTIEVNDDGSASGQTTSETIENNDQAIVTTTVEAQADDIATTEEDVTISLTTIYSEDELETTSRATTRANQEMMLIGSTLSCSDANATIVNPIALSYDIDSAFQGEIEARKYVNGSWQTVSFTQNSSGGVTLSADAFTTYAIFCTVNVTTSSATTSLTFDQSSWDNLYGSSSMSVTSASYSYYIGTNITTTASNKVTAYLVELLARLTSATYTTATASYPLNISLPTGTGMTLTGSQTITTYTVSSNSYQAVGQQYGDVSINASTYSRSHTGGSN